MSRKKFHIKKKSLLAYIVLGLLCLFLANEYRAEIGSIFHAASHILTGSDYSHVHEHPEQSHNLITPDQHDHKLLAFLQLLDRSEEMPIHSSKEQTIKLDLPEYAGMESGLANPAEKNRTPFLYGKKYWHSLLFLDVLTPPPKI